MKKSLAETKRIDLQLVEIFPNLTRTSIKNLILEGIIKINDQKKMPNYRPKAGDYFEFKQKEIDNYLNKTQDLKLIRKKMNLKILFEDNSLIGVFKPIGLNVHPVRKNDSESLLNGLYYYINNSSPYKKNLKIRLVNRIDKDTDGIVLASKSINAHKFYSAQFEKNEVKKEYIAVVKGDFKKLLIDQNLNQLTIENFLSTLPSNRKYYSTSNQNGRLAKSIIKFDSYFNKFGKKKFSKILIEIKTGRSHQIRVHLSELGSPILGDTLYDGQKYKRLMLHAKKIQILNFETRKEINIKTKTPSLFIA